MMKSESEAALGQDSVPRYLRAYGSTYRGGRYSHTYEAIGGRAGGEEAGMTRTKESGRWVELARALGVLVVFIVFGAAVSAASSQRTGGHWRPPGAAEVFTGSTRASYREIFEERLAGSPIEALALAATNEYGEFDRRAAALYAVDMVVEPHRETKISVLEPNFGERSLRFRWLLVRASETGIPLDYVEAEVDAKGGAFATVTLTEPGETYALLVQQVSQDGSVTAEGRATVVCKYVRREIRDLTDADRTAFFKAMQEFYTVPLEQGKERYGVDFANAKRVAAFHNSEKYCYHNGVHFLTAHASFDLWVERSLQMIDPRVSLASWDFMRDSAELGSSWTSSEIFGPDMFGSATGSPENDFQIVDGWFAEATSLYDPADKIGNALVGTNHNPYGYVDASYNYQHVPGVIRTNSFCGLEGETHLAQCDTFLGCYSDNDNVNGWATCMETQVHASMHGSIGGGFNCKVNMAEFQAEHEEFSSELLTFALTYVLASRWPSNTMMADYNECDEVCEPGQEEPCGCTCNTDPFEWSDDEVYDLMESHLEILMNRAQGDLFVTEDTSARHPLGFMQDGERLDEDTTMLLLRQLMVVGCEPGWVGAMSTGASPLDPIFWVLHPMFEKAFHILQLSPGYRDTYDFEWAGSECAGKTGGRMDDVLPFTEKMLGFSDSPRMVTNAEIVDLLHPSNSKLPYLYESFASWGSCTDWDPCPECVSTRWDGGAGAPPLLPQPPSAETLSAAHLRR